MKRWAALALVALGCAQGEPIGAGALDMTEPAPTAPVDVSPPEPVPFDACDATLSPEPEIYDLTVAQIAAWNTATGCSVHIGEGGMPVHFADQILSDEGLPMWGTTIVTRDRGVVIGVREVQISRASRVPAQTLRHELGQFLGADGHTATGLMRLQADVNAMAIDEAALALVCEHLACREFNPEP